MNELRDNLESQVEATIGHALTLHDASQDDDDAISLLVANGEIPEDEEFPGGRPEQVQTAVREWPLSVETRNRWRSIGDYLPGEEKPREARMVLATGGPHVEVVTDLELNHHTLTAYWGNERIERRLHGRDSTAFDWVVEQFVH